MKRYLTLATLGVLFLGACENSVTVPVAPTSTPNLAQNGKDAGSGASIIREGIIIALVFGGDPRDGLALSVGVDTPLSTWCNDPDAPVVISPARAKGVLTPTGRRPIHTFSRESYVEVFEYGGGIIVTDPCPPLANAPVVATGRVKFTTTLSDFDAVFGDGIGGPGAATLHATVQGVVDLTGGGQARLFGTVRVVFDRDGEVLMDEERVRLTPL